MRLSDLSTAPEAIPAIELSVAEARAVLRDAGRCYANANSGELVRAAVMRVPFLLPLAGGDAGDVLIGDEYGAVFALDAATFRVAYNDSGLCPAV